MTDNSPSHPIHLLIDRGAVIQHTQYDVHARDTSAPPDDGSARPAVLRRDPKGLTLGWPAPGKAILHFWKVDRALHIPNVAQHRLRPSVPPALLRALETDQVDADVRSTLAQADFRGVSATIPLKRDITPQLDELTPEDKAIGAVNTVIPFTSAGGHRGLLGDNTEWIGIRTVVKARLPPSLNKVDSCLVIGAGGTAHATIYTLHVLSVSRICMFNRTRRSAEELVHAIPDANVELLGTLDVMSVQGPPPSVIVSTVPASATTTGEHVPDALFLPSSLFSADVGVVVDMA